MCGTACWLFCSTNKNARAGRLWLGAKQWCCVVHVVGGLVAGVLLCRGVGAAKRFCVVHNVGVVVACAGDRGVPECWSWVLALSVVGRVGSCWGQLGQCSRCV